MDRRQAGIASKDQIQQLDGKMGKQISSRIGAFSTIKKLVAHRIQKKVHLKQRPLQVPIPWWVI